MFTFPGPTPHELVIIPKSKQKKDFTRRKNEWVDVF